MSDAAAAAAAKSDASNKKNRRKTPEEKIKFYIKYMFVMFILLPYSLGFYATNVHHTMPQTVQVMMDKLLCNTVKHIFKMKIIDMQLSDRWNIEYEYGIGKGNVATKLPSNICGAYYFHSDGLHGIVDTTYGDWNEKTKKLTLNIAKPNVIAVHDNFYGVRFYYISLLLRLKIIVSFDDDYNVARIGLPIFYGISDFNRLKNGFQSLFVMNNHIEYGNSGDKWMGHLVHSNGTALSSSIQSLKLFTCDGTLVRHNNDMVIEKIEDQRLFAMRSR